MVLLPEYKLIINTMCTMDRIPQIVKDFAENKGFNSISFAGEIDGYLAFGVGCVDKNGIPIPMGLPTFVLLKNNTPSLISGLEGLELLDRLN